MPLVIRGTHEDRKHLGYVGSTCPHCNRQALLHVVEVVKKLTVYWIPAGTLSKWLVVICPLCLSEYQIRKEDRADILKGMISHQQFNELQAEREAESGEKRHTEDG